MPPACPAQVRPNTRLCAPAGTSQRYARASARAAALSAATRHTGSSPSVSRNSAWSSRGASPSARSCAPSAANAQAAGPYPSAAAELFSAWRARSASVRSLSTSTSAERAPSRCASKSSHASSSATSYMLPFTDFFTLSLAVGSGKPYNRNDSKNRPLRHIVRASCPASAAAWDAGSPAEADTPRQQSKRGDEPCARTESTWGSSNR